MLNLAMGNQITRAASGPQAGGLVLAAIRNPAQKAQLGFIYLSQGFIIFEFGVILFFFENQTGISGMGPI